MSGLPSVWNLLISTLVFFIAAWYVRRYLDEQGIPAGTTRGILVFTLASVVSWGAGAAVDWIQDTPARTDLSQQLKTVNPSQP